MNLINVMTKTSMFRGNQLRMAREGWPPGSRHSFAGNVDDGSSANRIIVKGTVARAAHQMTLIKKEPMGIITIIRRKQLLRLWGCMWVGCVCMCVCVCVCV